MRYILIACLLLSSGFVYSQSSTRSYGGDTYYDDKPGAPPRGKASRGRTKIEYEEKTTELPGQARKGRAYREGTKIKYR